MADRRAVAMLILLVAFAAVCIPFWPGIIHWDAAEIFSEARSGPIVNWWTGLGTLLLRSWFRVGLGVGSLWSLLIGLTVTGIYGCMRLIARRVPAAVLTIAVVMIPPVYGQLTSPSRSSAYLAFTLIEMAAVAVLLRDEQHRRRWLAVAATSAIMAVICRQTGLVDVFALGVFLLMSAAPRLNVGRWVVGISAALIVSLATFVVLDLVEDPLGVRAVSPDRATIVYDLTALSLETHHNQFPVRQLRALGPGGATPSDVSMPALQRNFRVWSEASLREIADMELTNVTLAQREVRILRTAWFKAVSSHPLDYLVERAQLNAALLDLSGPPPASAAFVGDLFAYQATGEPYNFGYGLEHPGLAREVGAVLDELAGPGASVALATLWPYWLGLMGATGFLLKRRARARLLAVPLAAAVALNQILLFFTSMSAAERYMDLLIPATAIVVSCAVCEAHIIEHAAAAFRWRPIRPALAGPANARPGSPEYPGDVAHPHTAIGPGQ